MSLALGLSPRDSLAIASVRARWREELVQNLGSALEEALPMNRQDAEEAAGDDYEAVNLEV